MSSSARPIQYWRPPRARTPLATAPSHSTETADTRSVPKPTISTADTGASDSSSLSQSTRGASNWTSPVAKMTEKPTSAR